MYKLLVAGTLAGLALTTPLAAQRSGGPSFGITPYAGYMKFGNLVSGPLGTGLRNSGAAVYCNTDGWDLRGRLPQVARLELDGFTIVVTHVDQFGSTTPHKLQAAFPDAEIIVFGHTHRPLFTLVDVVVTVMNPGGAGARRFNLPASVGILELEPGIPPRGRLVPLTPADAD